MPPIPTVTKNLLLACTAVFCMQLLFEPWITAWFALFPLGSGRFMPWQPITYAFLHGDPTHLFLNALGLWMFGSELERLWGPRRFLQFMAAGVLAAAAMQLLVTALAGWGGPTVGISGGVFALLLAYGLLFPTRTIMLLIPPIPMKARTLVIVFGVISLVLGLLGGSGVAHFAHLGGMVGGFLMIRYWRGQAPFGSRRR